MMLLQVPFCVLTPQEEYSFALSTGFFLILFLIRMVDFHMQMKMRLPGWSHTFWPCTSYFILSQASLNEIVPLNTAWFPMHGGSLNVS